MVRPLRHDGDSGVSSPYGVAVDDSTLLFYTAKGEDGAGALYRGTTARPPCSSRSSTTRLRGALRHRPRPRRPPCRRMSSPGADVGPPPVADVDTLTGANRVAGSRPDDMPRPCTDGLRPEPTASPIPAPTALPIPGPTTAPTCCRTRSRPRFQPRSDSPSIPRPDHFRFPAQQRCLAGPTPTPTSMRVLRNADAARPPCRPTRSATAELGPPVWPGPSPPPRPPS